MPINFLFDLLAPIYDRVIGERSPEEFAKLLELPTDGILLDAGGGTGRVSLGLKPYTNQLVICDLSRQMLRQAQEKGHANILQSTANQFGFADNSFDRIMVVDALHHFDNQEGVVCELLRVLKPGGFLLIEEPDMQHFSVKLVALAEKLALMGSHIHYPDEIKEMVEKCGVEAKIKRDGKFAAFIIARKLKI